MATAARSQSASPSSILHFIRSSPSPSPPPTGLTCLAPPSHPQLAAYSLYAHSLSSVSPPAVLLHHMLPSPPPLLSHTSLESQHLLLSADSAPYQPIDAPPYMFAAVPAVTVGGARAGIQPSAAHVRQLHPNSHAQYGYMPPSAPVLCPRSRRRLSELEEQLAYFKTEVCRIHLTSGQCQFGVDCQFAHSFEELRPRQYDSKYKTELCKRYHTLGASGCKFGVRCKFLHDEVRIKASDGEYWLCSESEAIIRVEVVPAHHYHRRQLLDQLTFFPPSGPVSPLSTSPVPPRRSRHVVSPPSFASEYAARPSHVPSLSPLPSFLAAAVSPAHSTRSVPVGGLDSSGSTSTGSSSGGGSSVGGLSYSLPARYRRVAEGEFVLGGDL